MQNLPRETGWHLRGIRRIGVEFEDVEIVQQCVSLFPFSLLYISDSNDSGGIDFRGVLGLTSIEITDRKSRGVLWLAAHASSAGQGYRA